MTMQPGVTRNLTGLDGVHWNILGQIYTPKHITASSFSWHAMLPVESFVPPHIHPTQDEFILMLEGRLDFWLGDERVSAEAGDLVSMPRGVPHGIFNNSGANAQCLFWVTPTGKLVELFRKLHNMSRPDEVARTSAAYDVDFLPPVRAAGQR